MNRYWKSQLQKPVAGGSEGPGTSDLPAVLASSSQDIQDATPEQKRREPASCRADAYQSEPRVMPSEPVTSSDSEKDDAPGSAIRGGAFVGGLTCQPEFLTEGYTRECAQCGEFFELHAQPSDDTRLYCDETCALWDRL